MRITIDKTMVGKVVYGIPTGNNARRGVDKQEPVMFFVKSMAKKYATLQRMYGETCDMYGAEEKHDSYCGSGFNAGYIFFQSLGGVDEFLQRKELELSVYIKLQSPSSIELLSDELLRLIAKELENEKK